jgi:hypothetical protein
MVGVWETATAKEVEIDEAEPPLNASWPGLSRPSTSSFPTVAKDVDARDKPGHDEGESAG